MVKTWKFTNFCPLTTGYGPQDARLTVRKEGTWAFSAKVGYGPQAYGPQGLNTGRKSLSLRSVSLSLAAETGQLPVQPVAPPY
ncbi:hypothetical protein HanIR_Chr17g0875771 [Helianthus annuus]|nr:hypothetical protein HanIR_Chr17g0875771 [Helianthus annuus]